MPLYVRDFGSPPVLLLALLSLACGGGSEGGDIQGPGPIATVSVSAPTTDIQVGETVQLTATALDPAGNPLGLSFEWSSGDDAVATVSPGGLVTGQTKGRARIYASTGDLSGSIIITVDLGPRSD